MTFCTFKSTLAAILLTGTIAAMPQPALAQGGAFGLRFQFGTDLDNPYNDQDSPAHICFTDYQLRRAVARQGFTNIYVGGSMDDRGENIRMRGTRGGTEYLMVVDSCDADILEIKPYRRAQRG